MRKQMTKTQYERLELQIRNMEDEILLYRRENLDKLAASSFSYYLYEDKVKRMRSKWEDVIMQEMKEYKEEIESLLCSRIEDIRKQNSINAEDYPTNQEIISMKERHEKSCQNILLD